MKKRIIPMLLAVLMLCALLPFGVLAADLPVYKELIQDLAVPDDYGLLKDLDGDGVEELFLIREDADGNPYGQVYTIVNGAAKKLIELMYDGPEIRESAKLADLEIVASGSGAMVVTIEETNTGAGNYQGSLAYWNEGAVTFYKLSNGELKQADVMNYKLLMKDGTDEFYADQSTITRNGKTISGDEMNAVFKSIEANMLDVYLLQQVYDATQGFFQDVAADQYYYVPVGWALDKEITSGTTNVDFSPASNCTRAQVVTFLWRAAGKPAPTSKNNPFTDVKAGAYYYDAVLWAVEKGITDGVSKTSFAPNETCTRGQVVTFLWRFRNGPKMGGTNPFSDVKSGAYYYDAVLWAVEQKVTDGVTATTFAPNQTCTRGQIVTFLYRAIGTK